MKYYCLHHSPATDRKQFLLPVFKEQNIEVEWIEDFLPDSYEVVSHPKIYYQHATNCSYLNNAEISLVLKHTLAIKKICEIDDYGIIFEDDLDAINFRLNDIIPVLINKMENIGGDILWIGSIPNKNLKTNKITVESNKLTKDRCSHCYMIHSNLAKKVIDFYSDIKAPSDWQWNLTIDHFNLKSCWSYPHIYQRSENKIIKSLIR
jgi:hypothetical protein